MIAQLVKIDCAAMLTGQSVSTLFDRADGASLTEPALIWVWDFSNGDGRRRDLRFWETEVCCPPEKTQRILHQFTLSEVLARILPPKRESFHAGEVDKLFQLRPRTRIDLMESAGAVAGRNFYSRQTLADFLSARWLGRRLADHFHSATGSSAGKPVSATRHESGETLSQRHVTAGPVAVAE